jgi:plastocyanin
VEGLGGVLRLAAVTCETFLGLQATALSGFDRFFGVSFRFGHDVLLDAVRVCGGGRLSTSHTPLALVQTGATSVSRAPRTACFLFSTNCGIHTSERPYEFPHRLLHVASFTVKRGQLTHVSFTAGKPGIYAVICTKHLPNMQGTLLVLPK